MENNVYIVSACRTPIGNFQGSLSSVDAPDLGATAAEEAVQRAEIQEDLVDEVIFGNVLTAGVGQAPARQVALNAGLPVEVPAVTVNKVCGSGLKTVMQGTQAILAGDADCILAGGMENMSQSPYLLPELRKGMGLGHGELIDHMIHDGLWDVYNDFHMGNSAEKVASEYSVSRTEQDKFALSSHEKALKAQEKGFFDEELVPVEIEKRSDTVTVHEDEGPREDTNLDQLGKLSPVFDSEGTVTAGNASGISDGASAVLVCSEAFVDEHNLDPLARITGYAAGGVEPAWVMMAPVQALKNLEHRTETPLSDYDFIEINEAFSAQGCALSKELDIPDDKLNPHGGSVALGHPIGCTGARILTTLIHALRQHGKDQGVAALCLGGGNSVSTSVEIV